ncbi:MAG: hypothetical protein ACOYXC_15035 [Candidatus Rifleibacteriota bacterium]
MFSSRVRLLSDYAQQYQNKANLWSSTTGLWPALLSLFKEQARKFEIFGYAGGDISEETLMSLGFAPFCEIDRRRIYFHRNSHELQVAISLDDHFWDLTDWGAGKDFVVRFVAECYFMVTRDDFQIDDEEKLVLQAVIGYIEPSMEEMVEARNLVYWTLVENVLEDEVVTDDESETMFKIRQALALNEKDVYEIHRLSLLNRYNDLRESQKEEKEIDLTSFERLKRMAERLGISVELFD